MADSPASRASRDFNLATGLAAGDRDLLLFGDLDNALPRFRGDVWRGEADLDASFRLDAERFRDARLFLLDADSDLLRLELDAAFRRPLLSEDEDFRLDADRFLAELFLAEARRLGGDFLTFEPLDLSSDSSASSFFRRARFCLDAGSLRFAEAEGEPSLSLSDSEPSCASGEASFSDSEHSPFGEAFSDSLRSDGSSGGAALDDGLAAFLFRSFFFRASCCALAALASSSAFSFAFFAAAFRASASFARRCLPASLAASAASCAAAATFSDAWYSAARASMLSWAAGILAWTSLSFLAEAFRCSLATL